MTKREKPARAAPSDGGGARPVAEEVRAVLDELERCGAPEVREEMGPRYGVHAGRAFGVPMAALQKMAKRLGRSHELAAALWESGWYEARLLASLVDEPERVTPQQMERWCGDFDNWGVCDTVCFFLFDRTPHAFAMVERWAPGDEEFVRRAAFALLACLALHDKRADDAAFARCLPLVETGAEDGRNFVKKAVSWALRAIGERNAALNAAAMEVAGRLAASPQAAARWVGKDTLRGLASPAVARRLASR